MPQFGPWVRGFLYVDPYLFAERAGELSSRFTTELPGVVGRNSFTIVVGPVLPEREVIQVNQATEERRLFLQDFSGSVPPRIISEDWESGLRPHQIILIHHIVKMARMYAHVKHSRTIVTEDFRLAEVGRLFGFRVIGLVDLRIKSDSRTEEIDADLSEKISPVKSTLDDVVLLDSMENISLKDLVDPSRGDGEAIDRNYEKLGWVDRMIWLIPAILLLALAYWIVGNYTKVYEWGWFPISAICLVIGGLLFLLRCKFRSAYGACEVICGIISVSIAVSKMKSNNLNLALVIQTVTSLYIIVRGFDNIDQGWMPRGVKKVWSKVFGKTGW